MKNPFAGLFRARDKPQDSVSAAPTFYFGTSGSGKPVNANTAIQLSTVYACVRVISETVASLPLGVYEAKDDGNRKAMEHPLYLLLHDEPNSEMTSFILREVMLAHLLLWGNSYCQIIRSGRNQITGLYPLLPDKSEPRRRGRSRSICPPSAFRSQRPRRAAASGGRRMSAPSRPPAPAPWRA